MAKPKILEVILDQRLTALDGAIQSLPEEGPKNAVRDAFEKLRDDAVTLADHSYLQLAWFGVVVGVLATLSTYAGTTAALIGLLFTAAGGSLLAWMKDSALTTVQRILLVRHVASLSWGLLLGLLIGFGLRVGQAWATGDLELWNAQYKAVKESESFSDKVATLRGQVLDKLEAQAADLSDEKKWNRFNEGIKTLSSLKDFSTPSPPLAPVPKPGPLVDLHAGIQKDLDGIRARLQAIVDRGKLDPTDLNDMKSIIPDLENAANKVAQPPEQTK
jgi:hypothetical protein